MVWWDNSSDERFWIYLAGILDGEGCIGIYKEKRKDSREGLRPYISICNTNEDLINSIIKTIPEHIYVSKSKQRKKEKHNFAFYIRIQNYHSVKFILNRLLPYLVIKKKKAETLLDYICLRETKKKGTHIYHHVSSKEYEVYNQLTKLNKKGVE